MWSPAPRMVIDAAQRRDLRRMVRSRGLSKRVMTRVRIVLAAAEGVSNREVERRLRVSRPTVIQWRARFMAAGVEALLHEAPRPGRPRRIAAGVVEAIVRATLETVPHPAGRWSVRAMAAAYGLSPSTVRRIWTGRGLLPHLVHSGAESVVDETSTGGIPPGSMVRPRTRRGQASGLIRGSGA